MQKANMTLDETLTALSDLITENELRPDNGVTWTIVGRKARNIILRSGNTNTLLDRLPEATEESPALLIVLSEMFSLGMRVRLPENRHIVELARRVTGRRLWLKAKDDFYLLKYTRASSPAKDSIRNKILKMNGWTAHRIDKGIQLEDRMIDILHKILILPEEGAHENKRVYSHNLNIRVNDLADKMVVELGQVSALPNFTIKKGKEEYPEIFEEMRPTAKMKFKGDDEFLAAVCNSGFRFFPTYRDLLTWVQLKKE